jgi:hypothetical protein
MMRRKGEKKWRRRRCGVGRSSGGKRTDGRSLVVNVSTKVKDCSTAAAFLENCFDLSDDLLDP